MATLVGHAWRDIDWKARIVRLAKFTSADELILSRQLFSEISFRIFQDFVQLFLILASNKIGVLRSNAFQSDL